MASNLNREHLAIRPIYRSIKFTVNTAATAINWYEFGSQFSHDMNQKTNRLPGISHLVATAKFDDVAGISYSAQGSLLLDGDCLPRLLTHVLQSRANILGRIAQHVGLHARFLHAHSIVAQALFLGLHADRLVLETLPLLAHAIILDAHRVLVGAFGLVILVKHVFCAEGLGFGADELVIHAFLPLADVLVLQRAIDPYHPSAIHNFLTTTKRYEVWSASRRA